MNRLTNVNRAEGYYLTGEILQVIIEQASYYTSVLDGLNLPKGTVVFLGLNVPQIQQSGIISGVAYVVGHIQQLGSTNSGEIYKVNCSPDIDLNDLLANGNHYYNVVVNETYHDTTINNNVVCATSYITNSISIEDLGNVVPIAGNEYRFYRLKDILKKTLGLQPVDLFSSLTINGSNLSFSNSFQGTNYCHKVLMYDNYMDVQLYVNVSGTPSTDDYIQLPNTYTIPFGTLQVFPNHLENNTLTTTYIAYIYNNKLYISGDFSTTAGPYVISGRIYF